MLSYVLLVLSSVVSYCTRVVSCCLVLLLVLCLVVSCCIRVVSCCLVSARLVTRVVF